MTKTTIELRPLAIVGGVVSAGLAIYSLVHGESLLEPQNILIVGAVVLAILFGHITKTMWATSKAAGFAAALVFVAATFVTAINSAGRQAETADTKTLAIQSENDKIANVEANLKVAQISLWQKTAERNSECAGAPDPLPLKQWPKCRRLRGEVEAIEARIAMLQTKQLDQPAPKPVHSKANKVAELAALFGFEHSTVQRMVELLEPFLIALMFEMGAIVGFSIGFGHVRPNTSKVVLKRGPDSTLATVGQTQDRLYQPSALESVQTDFNPSGLTSHPDPDRPDPPSDPSGSGPDGPGPSGPRRPAIRPRLRVVAQAEQSRKSQVLAYIRQELDAGRTFPSQRAISSATGVATSTLSDWMRDWDSSGLLPRRTDGRCKRVG